jgi:ribosomal 30S subunit maturation factor RimM
VEKVEMLPANENLVIRSDGGGNQLYVPLADDYVSRVDITSKKIILKKLPEYL